MKLFTQQALLATINDLVVDVARTDTRIEVAASAGKPVVDGWSQWFDRTAAAIIDVRDGVAQLRPDATAELAALRFEAVDLAHNAGLLEASVRGGNSFGASWANVLDSTLDTLRSATQVLAAPAPVKVGPARPSQTKHA
jgi:hypothetical protein